MEKLSKKNKATRRKELGASLVEYGLLIALIAVVVITGVRSVGTRTSDSFENAREGFTAAGFGPCGFPLPPCPGP